MTKSPATLRAPEAPQHGCRWVLATGEAPSVQDRLLYCWYDLAKGRCSPLVQTCLQDHRLHLRRNVGARLGSAFAASFSTASLAPSSAAPRAPRDAGG